MKPQNKFLGQPFTVSLTVLLFCCTINLASAQTREQIAEKALASTVSLEMKDSTGKTISFGSGFFVTHNLIATNYHVIAGAVRGTAKRVGSRLTYSIEGITATDEANDLVLLMVFAPGIKPLPIGDSNAVKIGETVYVAGNPKGLEGTFSDGIISSRRRVSMNTRLQMTAPISPGSSGGPVLNRKGEVIGVAVATHRDLDAQNLNFAIPAVYLKRLLARSGAVNPLPQGNRSTSAETYFKRGTSMYDSGLYQEAIAAYTQAIRLKPDYADAYNDRGVAKDNLGKYFAAIQDYNKAIQLKPDYAEAYYNRGNAKSKLGQFFAAIQDYDTAIQLKPDLAQAYHNRGIAKVGLGQRFAAIQDYDKAIQLKPDLAQAYYNRGIAKSDLSQHFAAIQDYDKAIQLKPNYAKAYFNRGRAKASLGQQFAAIQDYDKAIQLQPELAQAYYNRGIAKGNLGQSFDAIQDYDKVIQLQPDLVYPYIIRGNAKSALGQHFAAIQDYDKAIQLKPDDATVYYFRGYAKIQLNRTWEAKQDLRKAWRLAEQAGNAEVKTAVESALQILE